MATFQYVNVKDFGATGNGVSDDTSSIQNAINSAVDGSTVVFPGGTYKTSNTININKRITLSGGKSKIKMVAGNCFQVNVEDVVIEGFSFEGSRLNNNHSAIIINLDRTVVRDCDIRLTNHGIRVLAGTWHTLSRIRGRNIVTGFIEIGNVVGTVVEDVRYDTDVSTYPQPQYGIWIYGEGCNISDIDLIHAGKCLWLQCISTRDNTWNFFNSCSLDTSQYGLYIENKTSNAMKGQMFDQCWFSSHSDYGVYIEGSGPVNGVTFSDCTIINNQREGVVLVGNVDNVEINGCVFSGNSCSAPKVHHNIYSNMTGKKYIRNNQFSNWGGFSSNVKYDLLRAEQDGPCVLDGNTSMGQNGGGYISGSPVAALIGRNFGNLPSA